MSRLTARETLPDVHLTDREGRPVALSELTRRRPAAVFLFHGAGCAACRQRLGEFAAAAARYAEYPAAVVAVPLDAGTDLGAFAGELQRTITLAHDPRGRLRDRFAPADPRTGERTPCCLVADTFGEVYAVLRGEAAVEQREVLAWLDFIDVQCPE